MYKAGDYNINLINTNKGCSILVQYNVNIPRPYDRINLVQGTKDIFRDYRSRIFLEGQEGRHWQDTKQLRDKYEHDLWRKKGEMARKLSGHGGMDT